MRHDNDWTWVRLDEFVGKEGKVQAMLRSSEPWHEPADVATHFAIANEPVIVQLLASKNHGCLRRAEQPVIGPERATYKADWPDRDTRTGEEMNSAVRTGRRCKARSKIVLQNRSKELVIAGHENDGFASQLRSGRQPFHGRHTAAVDVAGNHGNIELTPRLAKSDGRALLSMEIG